MGEPAALEAGTGRPQGQCLSGVRLYYPLAVSSACSQPLATAQSRLTVAGDTRNTAAERPPKTELDDPRLLGIELFEFLERAIQRERVHRIDRAGGRDLAGLGDRDVGDAAAAFCRCSRLA